MARTVNQAAHAAKRNQILDALQRLLYTKGYEGMTLQDILDDVQISSGAFYHYFDSKAAVLGAFIERMRQEVEQSLLPIVRDSRLNATAKLQGFFDTLDCLRIAHKADVIRIGQVWYADENAIVRLKVDEAVIEQRAPLLAEIVRQGVQEGSFTTPHPDQAGQVILSLLHGMGNTHARLLLSVWRESGEEAERPEQPGVADVVDKIIVTHAAYMDAIERVLGAPPYSLYRADAQAVSEWVAVLQERQDHE
jgi:TetR/AcrR family transcriptional regulator, transcriptional repressor for nem operon